MAAIIIPTRWKNNKPPIGSQINYGHPLAQGLVGCWLMNERGGVNIANLVKFNKGTLTNGFGFTVTPNGVGVSSGSSSGRRITLNSDPLKSGNNPYSIVALFMTTNKAKNGTVGGNDLFFVGNRITNQAIIFTIQNSNIILANWAADLSVAYSPSNNTYNMCVGTYRSGDRRIYVNGIQVASDTYSSLNAGTAAPTIGGGRGSLNTTEGNFSGNIIFEYIYNWSIKPEFVRQLYSEPYCFIQPIVRRFYSIPQTAGYTYQGIEVGAGEYAGMEIH